jgi:hypothetical protein
MSSAFGQNINYAAGTEFRRYHLQYRQTDGQYGGTMVEDTWNTRVLNYEVQNQIPGASVSSNAITLPAGTYRIRAECEGTRLGSNRLRLYQTSGTPTEIMLGRCTHSREVNDTVAQPAVLIGEFTSSATHTYEIQHHCSDNSEGGTAASGYQDFFTLGPEIFADVVIEQEVDATNIRAIETGKLLHVQERYAPGTAGLAATASSWNTRALNDPRLSEIDGASVAANAVTLPAGTYYVEGWGAAQQVDTEKLRVRQTSGTATTLLVGSAGRSPSGTSDVSYSRVAGKFTLGSSQTIELQHFCKTAGFLGYGDASHGSEDTVHSEITIWKVDA